MSKASSANDPRFAANSGDKADKKDVKAGSADNQQVEPPVLKNAVEHGPALPPLAAKAAKMSNDSTHQRRFLDGKTQGPTIDNVRELLLGDSLKQAQQDLLILDRKASDQLGTLREELGGRVDRVVRALSTVNQAIQKELTDRELAVQEAEKALTAQSEALATKMEDRFSFLEAKIYTVVADMERKVVASQTADKDKLVEQLAESDVQTESKVAELTAKVERQMDEFGARITTEISQVSKSLEEAQAKAVQDAEALGGQMGKQLGAVESKLKTEMGDLKNEIGKSSADLRLELTAHAGEQKALLAETEKATQTKLAEHVEQLEGRKVSRSDFSVMLSEMADRLAADEASKQGAKAEKGKSKGK